MFPIAIEPPAVEPVSLAEMRAYLRLTDEGAEDELVAALIRAAREVLEAACGRVFIESRWLLRREGPLAWPTVVFLPSPVIAMDRVGLLLAEGGAAAIPPDRYRLEAGMDPPRVVIDLGAARPGVGDALEVEFRAGYGPTREAVPGPLRQAVRSLVARWFENRGDAPSGAPCPRSSLP